SAISVALSKNKKESVKALFLAIDDFEKEFGVNKNEILLYIGKKYAQLMI
ncbi:hypothetical protein GQR23_003634, partial [Escherichia coli]|nr:hypothetical protein [Escherichia coli]